MVKIVVHERWKCIGCGACAAVAPDFWEMADDGYADLKGAPRTVTKDGIIERVKLEDKNVPDNTNAADSCPVNCIHIKEE